MISLSRSVLLSVVSLAGLATASPPGCDANNCERAFNGNANTLAAASFCSQFTTATTLTTNGFPSFATPACSLAAQMSSVCSCAYPASTSTLISAIIPIITPAPICPLSCSSSISSSLSSSFSSSLSSSLSSSSSSSSSLSSSLSSSFSSSTSSSSSQTSPSSSPSITTLKTSGTTLQTSASTLVTREYGPGCNADNCLRAFDRGNGNAFCSIFTLGKSLALPTYATQCTGSTSARVSSACTCLNYYGSQTLSYSSMSPSPTSTSSSSSSSTTSSPTVPSALLPTGCNSDNCLRAMKREGGVGATAFCSAFTTAVVTNTAALPTYQTQCTKNAIAQISSACSCLPMATVSA